jgi:hypothetical protein
MTDELPQGWASIALGDLFDFKYGKGLPQEKRNCSGSVNVYGSNGVVGVHNAAVTCGPTIIVGRKGSVGEVHLSTEAVGQSTPPISSTSFSPIYHRRIGRSTSNRFASDSRKNLPRFRASAVMTSTLLMFQFLRSASSGEL